jgi:branched-chain amino acid transport system permease protein
MLIQFEQALLSGLSLGAIYALAASGLGIIFGLFRVINFAHTQNMMIAAVAAVTCNMAGLPYIVCLLAGVSAAAISGVIIERLIIRPLLSQRTAQIDTLFVTLGLAIVIENVTLLVWGAQPQYFVTSPSGVISLGDVSITFDRLATIATSFAVFVVLHLATRTKFGQAILASAQSPEAARVVGLPVTRLRAISFAIGCGLAGLGGVFWGTTYSVSYVTGGTFLILSFVLVVMSGPGNISGILFCSILLGLTEALSGAFIDAKWQRLAVMLVFIAVVVKRPEGFGRGQLARNNT